MRMLLIAFILLLGCTDKKTYVLSDFIEVDAIEKVHMRNNSGSFDLNPKQLATFKKGIGKLEYQPGFSAKVGGIGMEITVHGQTHLFFTNTHGAYLETSTKAVTMNQAAIASSDFLYFRTTGFNFDNFKPAN